MRNYKSLETHHDFYKGVETINHVKTASDNFVFKSKRKVRVTEEPHQPWVRLLVRPIVHILHGFLIENTHHG